MKFGYILRILLVIILLSFSVSATYYPSGLGSLENFPANINLQDPYNVSATYFIGSGELLNNVSASNMTWTGLYNYPVACPGSSAITQLNDTITCQDLWVNINGDNMTGNLGLGGSDINYVNYLNSTNIEAENLIVGSNSSASAFILNGVSIDSWNNVNITYSAGSGISLSTTTFSVAGNTALTQDADGLSVTADGIGDTQLEYDTGQALTTISSPTFGNGTFTGNVTANNVYLLSYLYTHSESNISIASAGVWYNASFDTHDDPIKKRITHTYNDETNNTFTIIDTGIYEISWNLRYTDSAASPSAAVATRILQNGVEIEGSYFEKDTTKQNAIGSIHHDILASLTAEDEIRLSVTASATTIIFGDGCAYGDHCTNFAMSINRVG